MTRWYWRTVNKRQGLLIEEEVRELRAALAAGRTERDVLRMEMEAMALELETARELLGS